MTNKQYFLHLQSHPVQLGEFEISSRVDARFFPKFSKDDSFWIYVKRNGIELPFFIWVHLFNRSIITDIDYNLPQLCKVSPYELREWCPAVFLPWTNYLHWQKYLRIAFEIYVESNPKVLEYVR